MDKKVTVLIPVGDTFLVGSLNLGLMLLIPLFKKTKSMVATQRCVFTKITPIVIRNVYFCKTGKKWATQHIYPNIKSNLEISGISHI